MGGRVGGHAVGEVSGLELARGDALDERRQMLEQSRPDGTDLHRGSQDPVISVWGTARQGATRARASCIAENRAGSVRKRQRMTRDANVPLGAPHVSEVAACADA